MGTMRLKIGGTRFAGSLGNYHVQTAVVGGTWSGYSAKVIVDCDDISMFTGEVLTDFLPLSETVSVTGGKWIAAKAAKIAYKKIKDKETKRVSYELKGYDNPATPNLSSLKLKYTPKKGTFKGSFKVYEI